MSIDERIEAAIDELHKQAPGVGRIAWRAYQELQEGGETSVSERKWFEEHDNIVALIAWMAEQPEYDKADLASAVEKPWKYEDEYERALAEASDRRLRQQPQGAF